MHVHRPSLDGQDKSAMAHTELCASADARFVCESLYAPSVCMSNTGSHEHIHCSVHRPLCIWNWRGFLEKSTDTQTNAWLVQASITTPSVMQKKDLQLLPARETACPNGGLSATSQCLFNISTQAEQSCVGTVNAVL